MSANTVISADTARHTAAEWYDGQFSGLYALASSGSPYLWRNRCHHCGVTDTMREVRDCQKVADMHDQPALQALLVWLHGQRAQLACSCGDCDEAPCACA